MNTKEKNKSKNKNEQNTLVPSRNKQEKGASKGSANTASDEQAASQSEYATPSGLERAKRAEEGVKQEESGSEEDKSEG